MARFYGTVQGNRREATRCGSKQSGLEVNAASWSGSIAVRLYVNEQGENCFLVSQERWHGSGVSESIASGVLGKSNK
jgi:hypothetical protein